ncbi:CD209 antigen-like protein C isoform X2 [Saccostrea cucullata]|uniref:CD209 antigen-like protein C isoform X2 n=1 Tax=Saccostrea cuccullata TaxID=36930 RepID=UPI002ED4B131
MGAINNGEAGPPSPGGTRQLSNSCPLPSSTTGCEPGWVTYHDKCYWFSNCYADWITSSSFCRSFHSKLAEPKTILEMNFLSGQAMTKGHGFWIGISDMILENHWVYASSLLPFTIQFWGHNEPNGGTTENCAFISSSDGKLIDHKQSSEHLFICEIENESTPISIIG